jgi:hypothetical protein
MERRGGGGGAVLYDWENKIRVLEKNSRELDTVRLRDRYSREIFSGKEGISRSGDRYLQIIPRPSKQDFFLCSSLFRRHSLFILDR